MSKAVTITDDNFEEVVLKSDKPVLVDFWATWCGPCLMMAPVVEELAEDFDGQAVIGKLDVDANPQSSAKFGIRSIPTMLVFKGGEVVEKLIGASSKVELEKRIQGQIS
ncbi:thioredoxin [Rapidithrix thailandica]|uniref:Thioredoxin n=1 Tax=Rapidithrix thailandica TaxID=413964 RepID=A0AAW9S7L0_9BACT